MARSLRGHFIVFASELRSIAHDEAVVSLDALVRVKLLCLGDDGSYTEGRLWQVTQLDESWKVDKVAVGHLRAIGQCRTEQLLYLAHVLVSKGPIRRVCAQQHQCRLGHAVHQGQIQEAVSNR